MFTELESMSILSRKKPNSNFTTIIYGTCLSGLVPGLSGDVP